MKFAKTRKQEVVMNSNVEPHHRSIRTYATAMWLACVLVAFDAHAADYVRSETVKFADLNVGTPAGAKALYGRIHAAAWHVCQQPGGELQAAKICMRRAQSDAVGKVNAPLLTALYQKKTGSNPRTIIANR
jgi:UrcA family protein